MGSTYWFLVKFENGRPEICSMLYESEEEVMEAWKKSPCSTVCETISFIKKNNIEFSKQPPTGKGMPC